MTTQHTPGPWRYWTQRRPESEDTCTFVSSDGIEILRAVTKTITEEDARLIASAPETAAERDKLKEINAELLEALEMAMQIGDQCSRGFLGEFQSIARAAIAKATGEQP